MTRNGQTLLHQIYPVELQGDTVVLRPRGDAAGFSLHIISAELSHVRELIQSGKINHLLIDLGNYRYFGSMVIGDLVDLAQLVRSRGGRTGLCEVSDDMASVLRLMQLDDQWEQFPSRAAGLHALARIPLQQRLWSRRFVLTGVAAAVLLVSAYWWFPRPDYARIYHAQLTKLWAEATVKRPQVGLDEWNRIAKRNKSQLAPIIDYLESRAVNLRATPAEQQLLLATRYHWLPWLGSEGFDEERNRQMVQFYLDAANSSIQGSARPPTPAIAFINSANPAPDDASRGEGEVATPVSPATSEESTIVPVSGSSESAPPHEPGDGSPPKSI
jgi:anti-anti-sigma factor